MSKGDKLYHDHMCAAVLNNPGNSQFSKDIIRAAIKRDPVDVANELQVLADMFGERADRLLEERLREVVSRLKEIVDK